MNNISKFNKFIAFTLLTTALSSCGIVNGVKTVSEMEKIEQDAKITHPTYSWQDKAKDMHLGEYEADQAMLALLKGDFITSEKKVREALAKNPQQPYALMTGAIIYEQIGRPNRARQYYEDLVLLNSTDVSILSNLKSLSPQALFATAKERLNKLNIQESKLVIEDKNGNTEFNISPDVASKQIEKNLDKLEELKNSKTVEETAVTTKTKTNTSDELFSQSEKFAISRFETFKELAEKGLITKQEFLIGRNANKGALLPLTSAPPAAGYDLKVPDTEVIVERFSILKEGLENRSITPKAYNTERITILEALLPSNPKNRAKPIAAPKGILESAETLRKLQTLKEMGLITQNELDLEQKAIRKLIAIEENNIVEVNTDVNHVKNNVKDKPAVELNRNIKINGLTDPF